MYKLISKIISKRLINKYVLTRRYVYQSSIENDHLSIKKVLKNLRN